MAWLAVSAPPHVVLRYLALPVTHQATTRGNEKGNN